MKKHGFRTSMIVSPLTIRWGRVLAVATLSLALSGMALAATDNDGCSSATLRGDYAFTVSGETVDSMGITFIHGVAMTNFDGAGNLTQVDFVTRNGALLPGPTDPTTGFRTSQTGTYKVNPDCTGSAEIHFPAPPGVDAPSTPSFLDTYFREQQNSFPIQVVVTVSNSAAVTEEARLKLNEAVELRSKEHDREELHWRQRNRPKMEVPPRVLLVNGCHGKQRRSKLL